MTLFVNDYRYEYKMKVVWDAFIVFEQVVYIIIIRLKLVIASCWLLTILTLLLWLAKEKLIIFAQTWNSSGHSVNLPPGRAWKVN